MADCRPFAVMRGNPMGKPMWIAFDVPAFRLSDEALRAQQVADSLAAAGEVVPVNRMLDTTSDARLQTLLIKNVKLNLLKKKQNKI